ncbi:MAG TPA: ABC transporter ATP-binding protein, partial [Erysipelothrix sp.]
MARHEDQTIKADALDLSLWKRILDLAASEKKALKIALGFILIESVIGVVKPLLNRRAFDVYFVGQGSKEEIIIYAIVYILIIALQAYLIFQFVYRSGQIQANISYETRQKSMEKLQELSFSYYDTTDSGWIMARVTSDIGRLSAILSWSLIDLVWGGFIMLALLIVMLVINWQLAMMVIIIIPFVYFVSSWFQNRMLKNYRSLRAINSQITSAYSEGISGAQTTKTLALEKTQYGEFSQLTENLRSKALKSIFLTSLYVPIITLLITLSESGIIWLGSEMLVKNIIQVGTLIMFTQFSGSFFQPLQNIAQILSQLQMAQASAERVLSLIETEAAIQDRDEVIARYGTVLNPKPENYEPIVGGVEFKDVNFHYVENEPILENFNLKVEPKQRIALVGETGSGKSTIVNLICRFYEPTSGSIMIDGKDYRDRSLAWLRSQLGYVLQSPHLFSGTIEDNIRYGKLDATEEEVIAAAKMVGAHDFITGFKEGYQTDVGEGGGRLSSGQKQLISFARAILVDPAIFVLDEATSSIDTETEMVIQHAVEHLLKDRT